MHLNAEETEIWNLILDMAEAWAMDGQSNWCYPVLHGETLQRLAGFAKERARREGVDSAQG
jgi:hypothetical protein